MASTRFLRITDSYLIDRISYDPLSKAMLVGFYRTNSLWRYTEVPPEVFGAVCSAASVGNAFNELVRNQYHAIRVHPKPQEGAKVNE